MIIKNKGMFLETILNNSVDYLLERKLLIQKIPINNSLISVENNVIKAKLDKNNFCDYIGIYKGSYLEFEAKETSLDHFSFSNIKQNQIDKLNQIKELMGISFLIIYFHKYNEFFGISLEEVKNYKSKKIPYSWFKEFGYKLEFDKIHLNIVPYINHLISCI
ncbi:Holliday junction-specific endonuclease [Spiroplasma helicoides]|uniref:Holliday junction resolvase RecU n=1 Tax=Spiroplasma helicoides TaxID=216938 RepID=A0A1B3SJX1_9MOLU|nr:Holliday junction resolvase RecU [Spiroplasma helicoides]AOG60217.1 Holliday junction-specific endonuclease [Spiroplasma helicoides]